MSREIKIRAWNKNFEEYDKVVSINFRTRDVVLLYYGIADFSEVVLEQYTGLKDKNGVEIYEGDIIKVTIDLTDVGGGVLIENRVVSMEFEEYIRLYSSICNGADIEIIGSIHKNKELLNE